MVIFKRHGYQRLEMTWKFPEDTEEDLLDSELRKDPGKQFPVPAPRRNFPKEMDSK